MGWPSRIAIIVIIALLLLPTAGPAFAAPEAALWSRWLSHDPAAPERIDHGIWDRFLTTYLAMGDDGVARLPYGRIAAQDRAALDGYLEMLSTVPIGRYSRAEQRAFWINLYNALVVKLVLDSYPVDSIRDIGFLSFGPWDRKLIAIDGEPVSLDDIEHRIPRAR